MDHDDTPRHPGIRLTGTRQDEHDALAELFLGDAAFAPRPMTAHDDAKPVPTAPTASPAGRFEGSAARAVAADDAPDAFASCEPTVELVVLGHLPVRASLWVRQYACQSARKRLETVALVRSAGDSVAVDLITGRQRAEIEPVESVEDAVRVALSAAGRVVLRVDETVEPELLERGGIDEVTILTGADEAAVVASYRLIKSLASSLDDRLDPELAPRLRVAVMGGTGEAIGAACQKIERACRAFLERPVEVLDASGRIDATGTATICRVEAPGSTAAALDALLGEDESTPATTGGLRLTNADDADDRTPSMPEIVVRPIGRPRDEPPTEPSVEPAIGHVEGSTAESVRATVREPLAALIEGLTPIESRCPQAPGVELACDRDGRVHAVATDEGEHAVARLLAASAWVGDNLSLLIRAEAGVSIPSSRPDGEPTVVLHLLSRRPSVMRAVLDTEVLLYALASVRAGGEEIMVATPLND